MADIADFTTYRSKWSLKLFDQLSITESITTTFLHRKRKSSHATQFSRKKYLFLYYFLPFSKGGSMSWNPLFGQLQIFVQDFPPFFSRLQYLFFGFRKRDNTSKKTWKSPLLDCLSALRKFPFPHHLFCWLFSCQNKWRRWWWRWKNPQFFRLNGPRESKLVSRALKLDYVTHAEKLSWLLNFSSILESSNEEFLRLFTSN